MAIKRGPNTSKEWFHAALQQEKGPLPQRWLLLEEKERWKNHQRRSHETQSSGHRGKIGIV